MSHPSLAREGARIALEVEAFGQRSLSLLKSIDAVSTALQQNVEMLHFLSTSCEQLMKAIRAAKADLGAEFFRKLRVTLEQVSAALDRAIRVLQERRVSLQHDKDIEDDDCVLDLIDESIDAGNGALECLAQLIDLAIESELDYEKPLPGEFSSVESLLEAMR